MKDCWKVIRVRMERKKSVVQFWYEIMPHWLKNGGRTDRKCHIEGECHMTCRFFGKCHISRCNVALLGAIRVIFVPSALLQCLALLDTSHGQRTFVHLDGALFGSPTESQHRHNTWSCLTCWECILALPET